MREWQFRLVEEQGDCKWSWSYSACDGNRHHSPTMFDSLLLCIGSAMAYGYTGGGKIVPGVSRRTEPADC